MSARDIESDGTATMAARSSTRATDGKQRPPASRRGQEPGPAHRGPDDRHRDGPRRRDGDEPECHRGRAGRFAGRRRHPGQAHSIRDADRHRRARHRTAELRVRRECGLPGDPGGARCARRRGSHGPRVVPDLSTPSRDSARRIRRISTATSTSPTVRRWSPTRLARCITSLAIRLTCRQGREMSASGRAWPTAESRLRRGRSTSVSAPGS